MNLFNWSCVWWCNCARLLKRARLSRLIALLLVVVVFFPLVVHYYLSNYTSEGHLGVRAIGRTPLDHIEDPAYLQAADIVARIKELKRIHTSVNNELRQLESKRQRLHAEISSYGMHADKLKVENEISSKSLQKLKITIENVKVQQQEAQLSNAPLLFAPRQILADLTNDAPDLPSPVSTVRCRMSKCFDYSRCPLTSGFRVYFYEPASSVDPFVRSSVTEAAQRSSYATRDPKQACVYVALLGEVNSSQVLQKYLRELPFWHGDGRNHILLNFAYKSTTLRNIFEGVDTARAAIVQSAFSYDDFRPDFDIIVPPLTGRTSGAVWSELPVMLPIRRKYFLSFQGAHKLLTSQQQTTDSQLLSQLLKVEADILQILKQMQARSADSSYEEYFYFYFYCNKVAEFVPAGDTEWTLCADEKSRRTILEQSTFSLVLAPVRMSYVSTVTLQQRLLESIKYGAVPVILGDYVELPFSQFLEWKRAAIILPKARITELHFLLRTLSDTDIFRYRQQGREIYEKYLGTTASVFETILLTLRLRLHIPSDVIRDQPSPSAFNASFTPLKKTLIHPDTEMEDILGPVEVPRPSPKFTRNFTFGYSLLDNYGDTFHSFPFTPFEPVLPSDAKFHGSWLGFRPIAQGQGGSGKEFTESLGGNYPTEQFTVVILTYEREAVLVNALERFKDLPYLNKVIVVWNSPRHPSEDLQWPEIGVRIVVIRSPKNSLNSRFLPYDEIETEAILSIDDDTHLRHDEIMFGFRVWREARDRLVGFPGRFHSWEPNTHSWYYNSNYTCELSMVLTGAAFYHKYYAYLYSYIMPSAIRDMVDEYMNCEDLAMNFLVSHITRKPPIKVTSRWTFRCPGCPKALSFDEEHFQERHTCLNFFVKVYGYMPLLYTQFRVDSVLFKTRIPHDKQKCFKFI